MENFDYLSLDRNAFEEQKFFKSLVVPRPIAFITSLSPNGIVNAAPFSYFNIVSTNPCLISVSISKWNGKKKDTAQNILSNREFVANICPAHFKDILDMTSKPYPPNVSEIDVAELKLIPSSKVAAPRIAGTLAQLECILEKVVEIGNEPVDLILGRVVNIHVAKTALNPDGYLDPDRYLPIARSIGNTYLL